MFEGHYHISGKWLPPAPGERIHVFSTCAEEAITLANDSDFGLVDTIVTRDEGKARLTALA